MQDVERPPDVQTLPKPARGRGRRVQDMPLGLVPRSEELHGVGGHDGRTRDFGQGPAVRPPDVKRAVRPSIDVVALLVDRPVVPATEQGEVRERGGATLGPVTDVMALADPDSAAWKPAAMVAVVKRPPQCRGNRSRPGADTFWNESRDDRRHAPRA
jgi:hypothetical protein